MHFVVPLTESLHSTFYSNGLAEIAIIVVDWVAFVDRIGLVDDMRPMRSKFGTARMRPLQTSGWDTADAHAADCAAE